MEDEYETVYIVTAPFTGNEEEIAANFIIDNECGAETQVESSLNDNSCILTGASSILVENVSTIADKEYASIEQLNVESEQLHSDLQPEKEQEQTKVFNVVTERVNSNLQQDVEQEQSEECNVVTEQVRCDLQQEKDTENDANAEETLLSGNKRKHAHESSCGYRYQRPDIDIPGGVEVDEFTCPYCLKSFPEVAKKKSHMRQQHNVSFRSKGFIKCIECDMEFLTVNKLRGHLRELHELEMTQEIHQFPNMEGEYAGALNIFIL